MTDKELIRLIHEALETIVYQDPDGTWHCARRIEADITHIIGDAMNQFAKWEKKQND